MVICLCSCSDPGSSVSNHSDYTLPHEIFTLSASRTTGVAPLGVLFTANFSSSDSNEQPFHNLEYSWNFGDNPTDTWAVLGTPKNSDKGPIAAHVYKDTGDYTVTLYIRDDTGYTTTQTLSIHVDDPDVVFDGTTVCLSDSTENDFTGCPPGATQRITDDITEIQDYLDQGLKRILLHRGSSWETNESVCSGRGIDGPVIVGAYGDCDSPDERGICSNAPFIKLIDPNPTQTDYNSFFSGSYSRDWRLSDLWFEGDIGYNSIMGAATDVSSVLLFRIRSEGFRHAVTISHYETEGHDQIMIVDSDFSNAENNVIYGGSEQMVLMGNLVENSSLTHVVRIWQAFRSVISHNILSGANLDNSNGRHALKLHGPFVETLTDDSGNKHIMNPSRYIMISDNVFGGGGPWTVGIGPQNASYDERLSDVILEKNRFFADYGLQSVNKVTRSLLVWARDVTVRNNIFVGNGSGSAYVGATVEQRGIEPPPSHVQIYNNTFYKTDTTDEDSYNMYLAVDIADTSSQISVRNNLVHLPNSGDLVMVFRDRSTDLVESSNLLTDLPVLTDPGNNYHFFRDYSLQADSPAIDAGESIPVLDDFTGNNRIGSFYEIGAFSY